jgi:phosphate:Na+ symporter
MTAAAAVTLLGGLGMFLLGIHHITEGLKSLAGDSLRRVLQRLVAGRFSAVASGVLFTTAIQSSTATSLTVIGFVSAGLVTISQAIAVIAGATLGTTSTPWMVAVFGFRVRIADAALPILGIGAFLWLVGSGRFRSLGAVLAGFGLIFIGIEYLQNGMAGVSWDLAGLAGEGPGGLWILAGVGVVMTIVMQSSSAAGATTLVALDAGQVSFHQACALLVGQSVGTAATTALVVIGGSLAVKRTALAHVLFSLAVGLLAMVFLGPLAALANRVGTGLGDPEGVLALAAFSSIFKLAGILVFYPWLDRYAAFIVRITGGGGETAVDRLDPRIAEAGGPVALEAAWRATMEIARGAVDAVRRRLAGEAVRYEQPAEAMQRTERFLASLSLETTDLGPVAPRLVRLVHALDHLAGINEDLARVPPPVTGDWPAPEGFAAGARALAAWLDATADPEADPGAAIPAAIEAASQELAAERAAGRAQLLQDVAMQRRPAAEARAALDALTWGDGTLHRAWRLVASLQAAEGGAGRDPSG